MLTGAFARVMKELRWSGARVLVGVVLVIMVKSGVRVHRCTGCKKTAEAKNALGQMARSIADAYEGSASPGQRRLCPSASQPVPADRSAIRGKKYQSTKADWRRDEESNAGFACMGFEMTAPQYFQYEYEATADGFVVRAHGDLNGDGVCSTFELRGTVKGELIDIAPAITETDPEG